MNDDVLLSQLKEYLKSEYLKLSDQKEELIREKIKLEVEQNKDEHPLFDMKNAESIRLMFSPYSNHLLNSYDKKEDKLSSEIQKMENNVNFIHENMMELKNYISYVQKLEWKEDDSKIKDEEKPLISENLQDMLFSTLEFLKGQYEHVEFLMDMMEEPIYSDSSFNHNLVRILTYTISSTIESKNIDTVILEVKKEENRILVILQLLVNDEILDQYDYQFSLYVNEE